MSDARDRPLRARWRSLALDPDGPLGSFARLAACVYAEHSSDDRGRLRYPPSALTLADAMGCGERTAWRARRELVDAGFLVLEDHPGRTSGARLTLPTPAYLAGVTPARTPATRADGTRGTRENLVSDGAQSRARADRAARAGGRGNEEPDARRLVAGYVARLRELGAPVPRRLVGEVAKHVGELVDDGVPAPTIAAALALLIDKRLNPKALASLVPEAELGPRRSAADARADEWKEARSVYDRA